MLIQPIHNLRFGLMYNSYIKAGFTEEQAWKLTEIVFTNSTKKGIF